MEQERTPQIIYFKDLMFAALYQWRNILIVALVLALVLGGAQVIRVSRSRTNAPVSISEETANEIARLEIEQEKTQSSIDNLIAYLDESTLINMDPYQVYVASADIYISTDYQILPEMTYQNPDKTPAILRGYQACLSSNEALHHVAAAANIQTKYLAELVTCTVVSETNDTLNLSVIYPEADGAQLILDALISHAEESTAQIAQTITPHSISITSSYTDARTSPELVKLQTDTAARLDTLNTSLETIQADLKKLQSSATQAAPKSPVLFAIIGAVLGAVAVVVLAVICHIGTNKVYSARTLKNRTGIKILGCIPSPGKKNPVDKWLKKLEGRSLSSDQLSVVAATIRNYCAGTEHLLIMGQCDTQTQGFLLRTLTEIGIRATACGSLLSSVEALQALPDCSAVVLVEKCTVSLYTDVERTMELIGDHEKQLLGCVLLDG